MVTRLTLENFKAFAEEQQIPLKPITLVFGANSSGKSSILHALLLAKESMKEEGNLNADRTEAGGDSVDLGGFLSFVNNHDTQRDVRLAFDMTAQPSGNGRQDGLPTHIGTIGVDFAFGFDSRRHTVIPRRYEVLLDAQSAIVLFWVGGRDEAEKKQPIAARQINLDHPLVRETCEAVLLSANPLTQRQADGVGEILSSLVPLIRGTADPILPAYLTVDGRPVGAVDDPARPMPLGDDPERLMPFVLRFHLLPSLVFGPRRQLADELSRLTYLGPLRAYPPRLLMRTQHRDRAGDSTGANAWQALFTDEEARREVNEWLGAEKLKTPYEILVERLRSVGSVVPEEAILSEAIENLANAMPSSQDYEELKEDALDLLHDLDEYRHIFTQAQIAYRRQVLQLASTEEVEGAVRSEILSNLIAARDDLARKGRPGDLEQLVIVDKNADNMRVTHRDIGMGISQVLPVLVNAMAPTKSLVMIEQPEIHVHPALQAELGDVFIESALGERQNRFILETHSEHLILRIMRRMRETADGEKGALPAVTPDDVAVLYVDREGARSVVMEMRMDCEGQLIDHWPGGFFEEDFRERFG